MKVRILLLSLTTFVFLSSYVLCEQLKETKSFSVRGNTIEIGDSADSVFGVLKNEDRIEKPTVTADPNNPNSLKVTQHYNVNGKRFDIVFARREDPGPYRVEKIFIEGLDEQPDISSQKILQSKASAITTLDTFEKSGFCQQYGCSKEDSWTLRDGGVNNPYKLNISPSVSVEVETVKDRVKSIGMMFFERAQLSEADLTTIDKMLDSLQSGEKANSAKRFVRKNIEKSVPQIRKAKSQSMGAFQIWAGKVGPEQTVVIERR